jgi:hypothetical protein
MTDFQPPSEQALPPPPPKRRKRLKIFVLVIVLAVFGAASYFVLKTQLSEKPVTEISQLTDATVPQQGDFTFSEVAISRSGAKNIVTAKLKNVGLDTVDVRVSFILRNSNNNQLQGRKYETIEALTPNEEREISIDIIGEFDRSNIYELQAKQL